MSAYVIVDITVNDEETFAKYRARVPDLIRDYGGEYLVRGGKLEVLEGAWNPRRMVVLRFESMEAARRWWLSDDYAELKAIRRATTDTNMILVEGLPAN